MDELLAPKRSTVKGDQCSSNGNTALISVSAFLSPRCHDRKTTRLSSANPHLAFTAAFASDKAAANFGGLFAAVFRGWEAAALGLWPLHERPFLICV
jgi:hypothetical protein